MNRLLYSLLLFSLLFPSFSQAQQLSESSSPPSEEFRIDLEFRPRTEFRNGYRKLRSATTDPAFVTEQRSRLYLNYQRSGFIFHTSIQDVRVWGQDDPKSTNGTLQLFEAYVEPSLSNKLSARIGRQKIVYDNERLFSQNNWRQNGRSHDAVRLLYKSAKLSGDLIGAYNQEKSASSASFGTDYLPEDFNNYKILLANFWKWKASDKVALTVINATDGYQEKGGAHTTNYRFTSGGRIEHTQNKLYLTLAGYYQYGETPSGAKLKAYYYQPEIKFKASSQWTFSLGAEVFSGDDAKETDAISHSFESLYGSNHKFLGSLDYFKEPADLGNAGLIAPYLFIFYNVNKKLTLRADFHLFYSQNDYINEGVVIDKFLGFENDLLIRYNPNSYTSIDLGYSYGLTSRSMEIINKGGDSDLLQSWAFVMLTFQPNLFQWHPSN